MHFANCKQILQHGRSLSSFFILSSSLIVGLLMVFSLKKMVKSRYLVSAVVFSDKTLESFHRT